MQNPYEIDINQKIILPKIEEEIGSPLSPYAVTKYVNELYAEVFAKTYDNFEYIGLRYFNVYGPGEQHKGKMASVAYQAWTSHTFNLFPGDIKRDFIYVEDVVKANIHALTIDRGLFDVGTGKAETFENLLGIA